jgi:hypothetical protein
MNRFWIWLRSLPIFTGFARQIARNFCGAIAAILYQFGGGTPSEGDAVGHVPPAKRLIVPGTA